MDQELCACVLQHFPVPPHMVEMTVGVNYAGDAQPEPGNCSDDFVGISAGINYHPLFSLSATENEAVNPQRADYQGFENHNLSVMRIWFRD
jgi:hypothetical protein